MSIILRDEISQEELEELCKNKKQIFIKNEFSNVSFLRKCKLLEYLSCINNEKILNLEINSNINLKILYCFNTLISRLDLSSNTDLEILDCSNTNISELDLSNNINLKILICSNTNISRLNLISNINLIHLSCFGTPIKYIDLTFNRKLLCKYLGNVFKIDEKNIGKILGYRIIERF